MHLRRVPLALACLLAAGSLVAGCGDGSDSSGESGSGTAESRPAPPKSDFPSAEGKTLGEVLEPAGPSDLVVSPAALAFYKGENRYPFGVFQRDGRQVSDAKIALYFAWVPRRRPQRADGASSSSDPRTAVRRALDQPAVGPFPASIESLQTQPAFRAQTTTNDPDAASVVYVTHVDFPRDGEWRIAALIERGDETTATLLPSAVVGEFSSIPRVGERAPLIHTPTAADAGNDLSQITTRIPPDTQNRVDYADVLGVEPIILLFATPQFCQSRVCGPVVDEAEQVKQLYGDKAAFIHMEIYNDNDPDEDVRPQVRAFHLPTEPWLFAIDRQGTVRATLEGAFGVDELTRAVREVTGG
ncbi:MAG TPA: hypothetical protein VNM89_03525 [Solirubrobacterales bacterium]|nr:hypothetical protein [Solirubrobacterales bacterium]